MEKWVIQVKEESIKTRNVTLDKKDFKTQEEANRYVAEALQNISFSELDNFPVVSEEYCVEVDGEDESYWLD